MTIEEFLKTVPPELRREIAELFDWAADAIAARLDGTPDDPLIGQGIAYRQTAEHLRQPALRLVPRSEQHD